YQDKIHMFLGLQRISKQGKKRCIRHVIKDEDETVDLEIFEAKLKAIGGEWRIHKTVNARCPEKARKWLIKHLIDFPEKASLIDTVWRTALLQKECACTPRFFMLDVDTQDDGKMNKVMEIIFNKRIILLKVIKSPNGYHLITEPFDTREVCDFKYVTLLRDGYYYVKTIFSINVPDDMIDVDLGTGL
ncbi:MAG: hypothetical protein ACTSYR_06210, partial [Candidatus Odinarchaeia archaeon]